MEGNYDRPTDRPTDRKAGHMEVTHPITLWHKLKVTIKTGELIKCITYILVSFDKPNMCPVI